MFNGRNILPEFPNELIKVIEFLNSKANLGEFEFCDSISYWNDNEDVIQSLGLGIDGGKYYFAVSLAYIANLKNGNIVFSKNDNVWRWAYSLHLISGISEWSPKFIKRVILSFEGKEDGIDDLINIAVRNFGRANYDDGLALIDELPQYHLSIMVGLMENDYARYCNEFPPNENPEEFVSIFIRTYRLEEEYVKDAFDSVMSFTLSSSSAAMEFFLKARDSLDGDRKNKCETKVKELLSCGNTSEYVSSITNWILSLYEFSVFTEDCILMLVQGLGKENSYLLTNIDKALILHSDNSDFLGKLFVCVAENLEPMDILKLKRCLNNLSKNKEDFLNLVLSFILHPKGMYRLTGRKLWDEYNLETSDFKAADLDETLQQVFIISMLQDYGNPEKRLPKLLPLLIGGSEKVRSVIMYFIQPYVDDYMEHVTKVIDTLNIDCEEVQIIRTYVEERANYIKQRKQVKELSPSYTCGNVFLEAVRQENKHLRNLMKGDESKHESGMRNMFTTVMLARGGGWRDEDGETQHLPLTTFSLPSRMMSESMSPKEQDEWINELMKDWNDTTGDC